jgi:sigma-B regulation protein RsbU (phosphoserine phosphatase)
MSSNSLSLDESRRKSYESRFELGALFEFSTIINVSLDLKFILGHLLLTLMGKLLALRGIVLLEKSDKIFVVQGVKGLPSDVVGQELKIASIPKKLIYLNKEDARRLPWIKYFRSKGISFIVPLIVRDKVFGLAGFSASVAKKKLTSKEETYVKSLANIAAAAIEKGIVIEELRQVNRRLDGKVQELNTLFELSKEFNSVFDADKLVKLLMFSIMGQIGANRYFICMKRDQEMKVIASRLDQPLTQNLCAHFPAIQSPVLVESLIRKSDSQFKQKLTEAGVHVLIPLQLQNETKGILGLGEKMRGEKYKQTDLEFLYSVGNLAMISLENTRLFQEAIEKQKMEDELLIAKEIQKGLLPAELPEIPRFDIAATNISSKQVGGDYYDVIPIGNSKYVVAIGDVSGKGTPASLLMASLQAMIRALVPFGLSLSELTKRVNDLICDNTSADRFITFFWGILNAETRTMKYVSAGHNPPFLLHADGISERLDKGGIILGVTKTTVPYIEGETHFNSEDVLVLFTDGVSEAMNIHGEELGENKLEEIIRNNRKDSAATILSRIVDAVNLHSKNTPQTDDITLLVAKVVS